MAGQLRQPEKPEGWEYQFSSNFTGGLNLSVRPEDIANDELIKAENIRSEKNRILVDFGYKKFGAVLRGNVRATFQFFQTNGSSDLTAITNATFYIWRSIGSQWVYASDGTSTTLTAGEPSGEVSMVVGSIAGFSNGDDVGVELDDGTQHQTTVNGVPAGSTIVLAVALPSAAAAGKVLLKAVDLTGSDSIPVSIDVFVPSDLMIFTNGVDTPKQFNGTTVVDVPNLPGTTFVAFIVVVFKQHVMFLRTVEDGVAKPQRERHSDTGDPTNWTTGNAGFTDLVGSEDFIVTANKLGPYLIIYKERTVIRTEITGLAGEVILFTTTITGEGALSVDSVADLGDEHILTGNANIYSYKGGFNLEPVGDKIFNKVFSTKGELNPSQVSKVVTFYVEELDEVWIIYAAGTDTVPKNMVRYLVKDGSFMERKWPTGITGFGLFELEDTKDWGDLTGDWDAQNFDWGSKISLSNAPTTHLCLGTQIVEYDYLTTDDDGATISYIAETGDYYTSSWFFKLDYVEVALNGTAEILFSTDEGITFTSLGTIGPGSNFERFRAFKQTVARKIRFRFIGSSTSFGIEWFGFQYAIESEW